MHELLEIAASWSPWERSFPDSVLRKAPLPQVLNPRLALVVQGVRRCGKSTLMQQLVDRYRLDRNRCLFVNFEDPRLSHRLSHETLTDLAAIFRADRSNEGPLHFFLDEIQWVDGWQRWLRAQLDKPENDTYVISGSNARLLSGELGSALTGRHLTVELFPLDFEELGMLRPNLDFEDWLYLGGFPEPAKLDDGDMLLRQYLHDIVERDVRERIGGRSNLAIRQLVQGVFESAGSELSLRRIAGSLGIAVETAASWLEACQNAYLLFACPWFAWSERKRARRNVKYYPVDTGLRRVSITPGGADRSKALECATHLELRKRFDDVFYWRGKGEVDFVVLRGRNAVPIQVSWDEPKDRHHRALESFYEDHPRAEEAVIVTAESFHEALDSLDRIKQS
ncbi:MAG: ATP-binding protein [Xanthomonadales bacterium]|nr:ATP-binding protein [Xanthomonadales bacterium]